MTVSPKRILILRGGAVGDFILTLPVFAAIREHWPDAHVELVAYPRVARLVLETGLVDSFRSLDDADMARLFVGEDSTRIGEGFDLILSYLNDPDGIVRNNLERSGAERVICHPPLPNDMHATDHLMEPLKKLGFNVRLDGSLALPALKDSFSEDKRAREGETPVEPHHRRTRDVSRAVGIHPGSGSQHKNWPTKNFVSLAQELKEKSGQDVFFIIGEADEAQREYLARHAPDFPIVENLDLYDLAVRLSGCAGYVGNDSGVTHLAAAVGIPTVALFGPSDPAVWGPRGKGVRVVKAQRIADINVDEVMVALCGSDQ